MENTIIVENFLIFRFDKKYFHVKINIYGYIAKIQFLSEVFRLWGQRTHLDGGGEGVKYFH